MSEEKKQLTYADAGVDIDAGNRAVELMKDSVRASYRPEVIGDLGGQLPAGGHRRPGRLWRSVCVGHEKVQRTHPGVRYGRRGHKIKICVSHQ